MESLLEGVILLLVRSHASGALRSNSLKAEHSLAR